MSVAVATFFVTALFASVAVADFRAPAAASAASAPEVLLWFPTARFNASSAAAQLRLLEKFPGAATTVSYERWTLNNAGEIIVKEAMDMVRQIHAVLVPTGAPRIKAAPMLACGDIAVMRKLFRNPARSRIIASFAREVAAGGYDGVNVDLEGNKDGPVKDGDAAGLAAVVVDLQKELLRIGSRAAVSADVNDPTWGKWWSMVPQMGTQLAALPQPSGGQSLMPRWVGTMSTYWMNFTDYADNVKAAPKYLPKDLGLIGILRKNPGQAGYNDPAFMVDRLRVLQKVQRGAGLRGVALWCLPIPSSWWPSLQKYRQGIPL